MSIWIPLAFLITKVYAGPSGVLNTPVNGSVWNNTNGVGLGRVQYQGVDVSNDGPALWRIRTFSLDISLQSADASTIYYLARGIRPDPASILVDYDFLIPYTSGAYLLVVEETQQIFMDIETNYTRAYTYISAAPNITIVSSSAPTRRDVAETWHGESTKRPDPQPVGQLLKPAGDVSWNNTDGFGSGEVQYQGVNVDYSNGSVTHVSTLAVDVWLGVGTNPPYYLAKGIVPNDGETVDATFHIPPYLNGTYSLNINDIRVSQDPTLPKMLYQTENPALYITMAEPWLLLSSVNASEDSLVCENGANSSDPAHWPVPAIVLVAILSASTLLLLGSTVYGLRNQIIKPRQKPTRFTRGAREVVSTDISMHDLDAVDHRVTPFRLQPAPPLPPPGPSENTPPPPRYTRKPNRPPYAANNR